MEGSEYDLGMKNVIKRLSSGSDIAEQQQMLLALLQPIGSSLSFPHTEYASLADLNTIQSPFCGDDGLMLVCSMFFPPTGM